MADASKKLTNLSTDNVQNIVNNVVNEMSDGSKSRVATSLGIDLQKTNGILNLTLPLDDQENPFLQYDVVQNEFIGDLVNKIALTIVKRAVFLNPLRPLKTGALPLGMDVEEAHSNPREAHQFDPTGSTLHERCLPDVATAYHRINSDRQYCVTIERHLLRRAFTSWAAMGDLLSQIIMDMYNGNYIDEFVYTKALIGNAVASGRLGTIELATPEDEATGKAFVKYARQLSTDFSLPSTEYNNYLRYPNADPARPRITWTPRDAQILMIRSDVEASMDVDVLAAAFNLTNTEFLQRVIVVDNFNEVDSAGTVIPHPEIFAVICDVAYPKIFDQDYVVSRWANPKGLYLTYYLTVSQIYSVSPFANAVAFIDPANLPASASPTINPIADEATTVTGTGVNGATITITWPNSTTSTALVASGAWTATAPVALATGQSVSAIQKEPNKKNSASVSVTVS